MWILFFTIWILGVAAFYILDGWFDYQMDEVPQLFFFAAISWFVWIWFVIPGILAWKAHEALKEKKKKFVEKKEKELKIRVAAEKELEKIQEDLDIEIIQKEAEKSMRA